MKKTSVFLLLLFALLWTCERDDICAESTPTTPRLIIQFNDISNLDQAKAVRQLTVIGLDEDGNEVNTLIQRTNTDQIALPLKITSEGVTNFSSYKLIRDADYDTDNNPNTISNTDIVNIAYIPEFVYVSSACGFKSIFKSIGIVLADDNNDPWLLARAIIEENVENENNAQIILFH